MELASGSGYCGVEFHVGVARGEEGGRGHAHSAVARCEHAHVVGLGFRQHVGACDSLVVELAQLRYEIVALAGGYVVAFDGYGGEAFVVLLYHGVFGSYVAVKDGLEVAVDAVFYRGGAHGVEMYGDVEGGRQEGVAPGMVHFIIIGVAVVLRQEIIYDSHSGYKQGRQAQDLA